MTRDIDNAQDLPRGNALRPAPAHARTDYTAPFVPATWRDRIRLAWAMLTGHGIVAVVWICARPCENPECPVEVHRWAFLHRVDPASDYTVAAPYTSTDPS